MQFYVDSCLAWSYIVAPLRSILYQGRFAFQESGKSGVSDHRTWSLIGCHSAEIVLIMGSCAISWAPNIRFWGAKYMYNWRVEQYL